MGRKGPRKRQRPGEEHGGKKKPRLVVANTFSLPGHALRLLQKASGPNPQSEGPYTNYYDILLVGEGDFSFALALATALGGSRIVATSYDSRTLVMDKYPHALQNMAALQQMGVRIHHGVDASKLQTCPPLMERRFHQIVFNFPHAGGSKEEDVEINRALLAGFFESAPRLLHPLGVSSKAELHVTLRRTPFYDSWQIEDLAKGCGLTTESLPFEADKFARLGYTPQRTSPAVREAPSVENARLYILTPTHAKAAPKKIAPGVKAKSRPPPPRQPPVADIPLLPVGLTLPENTPPRNIATQSVKQKANTPPIKNSKKQQGKQAVKTANPENRSSENAKNSKKRKFSDHTPQKSNDLGNNDGEGSRKKQKGTPKKTPEVSSMAQEAREAAREAKKTSGVTLGAKAIRALALAKKKKAAATTS